MNKIILMKMPPLKRLQTKPMILLRMKTQVETLIRNLSENFGKVKENRRKQS